MANLTDERLKEMEEEMNRLVSLLVLVGHAKVFRDIDGRRPRS